MKHYVICLADTDEVAQEVIGKCSDAGFAKEEIFVLSSSGENEEAGDREVEDGSRRQSLDDQIGLLSGIGPTVVGGAGHFMGTGSMEALDRNEGGEEGSLGHLGLSEGAAREYQSKMAEGGILIAVQIERKELAGTARGIFEEAHCQEISEV
jgi:Heat induced stress protein YflT